VTAPAPTLEERYEALKRLLLENPAVSAPTNRGFGSSGLKVGGRFFLLLSGGHLMVKLPPERVEELVREGRGDHWSPRRNGRFMAEWLLVRSPDVEEWRGLAREAVAFGIARDPLVPPPPPRPRKRARTRRVPGGGSPTRLDRPRTRSFARKPP
jgi:hypothetical protein